MIPSTALATVFPEKAPAPVKTEQSGNRSTFLVQPVIQDRPASHADPSERVLYFDEAYDSYNWEIWQGFQWSSCSTKPELPLSKAQLVENVFRCTVTRNGENAATQIYANNPDVLEGAGVNLMWIDMSPHVDEDGHESEEGFTLGGTDYIEYFRSDTRKGDYFDIHGVDKNVNPALSFQTTY